MKLYLKDDETEVLVLDEHNSYSVFKLLVDTQEVKQIEQTQKKHYKKRTCSNCLKSGHRADKCPDLDDEDGERVFQGVTRDQVQELKDLSKTSLQVAAKLKCRLSDVNKHW
jgi:hypothetical protein